MSRPRRSTSADAGLSLLDRLSTTEESNGLLSAYRNGLKRDLEGLLNSRRRFLSWSEDLDELDASVLNYGLADFTNAAIGDEDFHGEFIHQLKELVRRLEPRIQQVEVTLQDPLERNDRVLRFRISGYVDISGDRQQVLFNSHIDPVRCDVVVKD